MVLSDASDASSVRKNKLYSTLYYEKYGNLLRSVSDNHLGGIDVVTNIGVLRKRPITGTTSADGLKR